MASSTKQPTFTTEKFHRNGHQPPLVTEKPAAVWPGQARSPTGKTCWRGGRLSVLVSYLQTP